MVSCIGVGKWSEMHSAGVVKCDIQILCKPLYVLTPTMTLTLMCPSLAVNAEKKPTRTYARPPDLPKMIPSVEHSQRAVIAN